MILEKQVVSLELAKKLKEFGCKQDSLFVYDEGKDRIIFLAGEKQRDNDISAYTVAELGEMLPNDIMIENKEVLQLACIKGDNEWECSYNNPNNSLGLSFGKTEADARAKMLIYLKENNLI